MQQHDEDIPNELLNGHEGEGTRRSTRQKKLMYNTFNMAIIDKQLTMLDEINDTHNAHGVGKLEPYQKKRKVEEVDPIPEDEVSNFKCLYLSAAQWPRSVLLSVSSDCW